MWCCSLAKVDLLYRLYIGVQHLPHSSKPLVPFCCFSHLVSNMPASLRTILALRKCIILHIFNSNPSSLFRIKGCYLHKAFFINRICKEKYISVLATLFVCNLISGRCSTTTMATAQNKRKRLLPSKPQQKIRQHLPGGSNPIYT